MLDFVQIKVVEGKRGLSILPGFIVVHSKDLMIRVRCFYSIWDESKKKS